MNLTNMTVIKSLFKKYNFHLSKGLGQNFLIDPQVPIDIVKGSKIDKTMGVIEIGPGIGVLTRELCKQAKKVVAVEIDDRLIPILGETLQDFDNVHVVHGDILKVDINALIDEHFNGMDVCICANLPYYITTSIVMALLEQQLPLRSITIMVQKEVAQRLCADETAKEYGAISLSVRYYSEPSFLFTVLAHSFLPAPKIDSAVIHFDVRKEPAVVAKDKAFLFQVIKASFSQRRKTMANAVSNMLGIPKSVVEGCLVEMGKEKNIRGEQLSLADYNRLSALLKENKNT